MTKRPSPTQERPSTNSQALEEALLASRMNRFDEAERLATQVLKADRGNLLAAQVLGTALLMQNRSAEAIDPLQRAARRSHDPGIEVLLAKALAGAGREADALERLRLAITRRPAFPVAFLELGDQLGVAGQIDEGISIFESGIELIPDAVVLKVGLAYLCLRRNDRKRARSLFLQARAASPERRDAMVGLARVMALDGEHASASDLYRRALSLRPDDALTRIELGKCLLELGQREAGETALRMAVRSEAHLAGPAVIALSSTPNGRFFLRPSAAAKFLRLDRH